MDKHSYKYKYKYLQRNKIPEIQMYSHDNLSSI